MVYKCELIMFESIILEKDSKYIIFMNSLSTIKSKQNQFELGGLAIKIQNNLNETAEQGKQITILYSCGYLITQK